MFTLYSYGDLLPSLLLFSILPVFIFFPCDHYSNCVPFYCITLQPIILTHFIPIQGLGVLFHITQTLWYWVMVLHEVGQANKLNHSLSYSTDRQEVRTRQLQQYIFCEEKNLIKIHSKDSYSFLNIKTCPLLWAWNSFHL